MADREIPPFGSKAHTDYLRDHAPPKQGDGLPLVARGPRFCGRRWAKLAPTIRQALQSLQPGDPVEVLLDDGDVVRATVSAPVTEISGTRVVWLSKGFRGCFSASRCRPEGYRWHAIGGERLDAGAAS